MASLQDLSWKDSNMEICLALALSPIIVPRARGFLAIEARSATGVDPVSKETFYEGTSSSLATAIGIVNGKQTTDGKTSHGESDEGGE